MSADLFLGRRKEWKMIGISLLAAALCLFFAANGHIHLFYKLTTGVMRITWGTNEMDPYPSYHKLGNRLMIGEEEVVLPGRILSLSEGEHKETAVITAVSGKNTGTFFYDGQGKLTGSVLLEDSTAVSSAVGMGKAALLQISDSGAWKLTLHSLTGETVKEYPLSCTAGLEVRWLGETPVVRSGEGISLFREEELFLPFENISFLEVSRNGYLAVISDEGLFTVLSDGSLGAEAPLSYTPREMKVSGNRIYILYGEGIGCYNPLGEELWFSREGAKAKTFSVSPFGCVLFPYD